MPELRATLPVEWRDIRHGRADGTAGVSLRLIRSRAIVAMTARRHKAGALGAAVKQAFGVALPNAPRLVRAHEVSFLWSGHQQWLAMADQREDLFAEVQRQVGPLASLSDQSDSRLTLELSGAPARAILAKLAPIDLHRRAFLTGDTALSLFVHIPGQITQIDDQPTYELMTSRSFAESSLHQVLAAGAELGVAISGEAS